MVRSGSLREKWAWSMGARAAAYAGSWLSAFLLAGSALCQAAIPPMKMAILREVQVSGPNRIDLLFDAKVNRNQVQVEYFNDVIQVSLGDVTVYPAKISSVNGASLVKVFAYQYSPRLVRCRLTVRGNAESFRDKLEVVPEGRILSIRLDGVASGHKDTLTIQSSAPMNQAPEKAVEIEPSPALRESQRESLRESSREAPREAPREAAKEPKETRELKAKEEKAKEEKAKEEKAKIRQSDEQESDEAQEPKEARKPRAKGGLTAAWTFMSKLGMALGAFGVLALVLGLGIRASRRESHAKKGALGSLGKWMTGAGGVVGQTIGQTIGKAFGTTLGKKERMIEVLSTHYLGPKKSIVVVRVLGTVLVLGTTNDSMSLITRLDGDETDGLDLQSLGVTERTDSGADAALFADLLKASQKAPTGNRATGASSASGPSIAGVPATGAAAAKGASFADVLKTSPRGESVRTRIRSRLEGLKQL